MAKKKSRRTKEEREAWDRHVDATIHYMRRMCLRAINDMRARGQDVDPEFRALVEESVRLSER
ncbi:MAG TPA: hypothetical protein VF101_18225 [Gaiellaceae bacterium]